MGSASAPAGYMLGARASQAFGRLMVARTSDEYARLMVLLARRQGKGWATARKVCGLRFRD